MVNRNKIILYTKANKTKQTKLKQIKRKQKKNESLRYNRNFRFLYITPEKTGIS